ncbi:hypothetical protein ACLOJK_005888 [Asimina triloba]
MLNAPRVLRFTALGLGVLVKPRLYNNVKEWKFIGFLGEDGHGREETLLLTSPRFLIAAADVNKGPDAAGIQRRGNGKGEAREGGGGTCCGAVDVNVGSPMLSSTIRKEIGAGRGKGKPEREEETLLPKKGKGETGKGGGKEIGAGEGGGDAVEIQRKRGQGKPDGRRSMPERERGKEKRQGRRPGEGNPERGDRRWRDGTGSRAAGGTHGRGERGEAARGEVPSWADSVNGLWDGLVVTGPLYWATGLQFTPPLPACLIWASLQGLSHFRLPPTSPVLLSVPALPLSRSPSPASGLLSDCLPPSSPLPLSVPSFPPPITSQSQPLSPSLPPPPSSSSATISPCICVHLRLRLPLPKLRRLHLPLHILSASSQMAKPPSSSRPGSEFPRHLPNLEGKSSPNPKAETLISSPADIWISGEKTPFSLPGNHHPRLFFLRRRRPLPLILILSSFPYSSSPFMEFEPFSALKSSGAASSSSEQLGTTSGIKDLDSPSSLSPLDPPQGEKLGLSGLIPSSSSLLDCGTVSLVKSKAESSSFEEKMGSPTMQELVFLFSGFELDSSEPKVVPFPPQWATASSAFVEGQSITIP